MDTSAQTTSPTFPASTPDSSLASRQPHFTPILPDHGMSQEQQPPSTDSYDPKRSPTGSTPMEGHSAKRKKVNHGYAPESRLNKC